MRTIALVIIASLWSLAPGAAFAQKVAPNKGIEHIRKSSIEAQLAFLSSDALQGREAGKQGGKVAAEYIKSVLRDLGVKPYFADYLQPFESYSPARERHVEFQVHPDSIAKYKQGRFYRRLNLQNVVGYIEGKKKDEYVIIGAHYDHVGVDETLVGDQIYNGADDNGASVIAVLQVAKAFAASGIQPEKSIIFAFWDGEEINYLGSEYFVLNFPQLAQIKAYINLDMVGRRKGYVPVFYPEFDVSAPTAENTAAGKQFHLLYTAELTAASQQLAKNIQSQKLNVEPKQGVINPAARGSDQLSFSLRGVPVQWFFTGLHPDYHTPIDEIDLIDLDKLTDLTKAVYLSIEQLANPQIAYDPALPLGGAAQYERHFDVEKSPYYQSPDFYHLKSSGSLTIVEHFKTTQQATDVTCGPASVLMVLEHFGKRGNLNEQKLKDLRGTAQDTTYLRHLLNIFDAVGGFEYASTYDYAAVNPKTLPEDFFLKYLKQGIPVIVGTNEWNGHWQIIIGYDTMGTPHTADDVLILADPYDTTDHNQDGYVVYSLQHFYEGSWTNHYDPDYHWGLFVAAYPKTIKN